VNTPSNECQTTSRWSHLWVLLDFAKYLFAIFYLIFMALFYFPWWLIFGARPFPKPRYIQKGLDDMVKGADFGPPSW